MESYIYDLPKGTVKWLLNESMDTLLTKVNLKLWGKVTNEKCFCGQRQTLNHILNCCMVSLNQGWCTYQHDNILKAKYTCYIDILGPFLLILQLQHLNHTLLFLTKNPKLWTFLNFMSKHSEIRL